MKLKFNIPEQLNHKNAYVWLASWFGCGFISPASGTWGSLGAIPLGVLLYVLGGTITLIIFIIILTLVGLWAADRFDKAMDGHDSKMIVIDEVVGMWISMLPAALNPIFIFLSFICFRFFDIAKPWPVSFFDKKVKGAIGVMGDDIIAGIMAAICIIFIDWIF